MKVHAVYLWWEEFRQSPDGRCSMQLTHNHFFEYFRSVSSMSLPLHFAIGSRRMKRNSSHPVYMQAWHRACSVPFCSAYCFVKFILFFCQSFLLSLVLLYIWQWRVLIRVYFARRAVLQEFDRYKVSVCFLLLWILWCIVLQPLEWQSHYPVWKQKW